MNSICRLLFFLIAFVALQAFRYNHTDKYITSHNEINLIALEDTTDNKQIKSVITCPKCGFKKSETVPTDHCLIAYTCTKCHKRITPKKGDCCVFCSYGTVKCPTGDSHQ